MRTALGVMLVLCLATGCASPFLDSGRAGTVLPLNRAWVDGRVVEYITTDISDLSMAQKLGVNHVPRLAKALGAGPGLSVLERVYKFPDDEQLSVFQSGPVPVGAGNLDRNYSPLWRMVMVRWKQPGQMRELKSEEAILAAEDKGELSLELTGIVVNCPITGAAGGQRLGGVR